MRHRKKINKLGRTKTHREAMLANLASSLILHEYIVTTEAKAKACKSFVDKVFSTARDGDLYSKRKVERLLRDKLAQKKLFEVLIKKLDDRSGGFSFIIKLQRRKGDNARMAKLVLVGSEPVRTKVTRKDSKSKSKAKKQTKKDTKKEASKDKQVGQSPKRSLLDRVKDLRGRFGKEKGKDQTDRGGKDVQAKSRSGI
jgi:large subunit ribosomal protein L17